MHWGPRAKPWLGRPSPSEAEAFLSMCALNFDILEEKKCKT